ncbi:hypothetical protein MXB_2682 [Myxobolus squamalis]|nr:hypothetical protein MXB_2682 [Myxobolus squamalis]
MKTWIDTNMEDNSVINGINEKNRGSNSAKIHRILEEVPAHRQLAQSTKFLLLSQNHTKSISLIVKIRTMKNFWPHLSLTKISIDFKRAAICAVSSLFLNTNVSGSFFVLQKNML